MNEVGLYLVQSGDLKQQKFRTIDHLLMLTKMEQENMIFHLLVAYEKNLIKSQIEIPPRKQHGGSQATISMKELEPT